MMESGIFSLPKELLRKIRGHFGASELFEFSGTCKRYRKLFEPDIFTFKVYKSYSNNYPDPRIAIKYDDLEFYELFSDMEYRYTKLLILGSDDIKKERFTHELSNAIAWNSTRILAHPKFKVEHPYTPIIKHLKSTTYDLSETQTIKVFSNMKSLGYLSDISEFHRLKDYFKNLSLLYVVDRFYPKFRTAILFDLEINGINPEHHSEIVKVTSTWKRFTRKREFKYVMPSRRKDFLRIPNKDLPLYHFCYKDRSKMIDLSREDLTLLDMVTETYKHSGEFDRLVYLDNLSINNPEIFTQYSNIVIKCISTKCRISVIDLDDIVFLENKGLYKITDFSVIANVSWLQGNKQRYMEKLKSNGRNHGIYALEVYCFRRIDYELLEIFFNDKFWVPKPKSIAYLEKPLKDGGDSNTLDFLKLFVKFGRTNLLQNIKMPKLFREFIEKYKLVL